MTKIRRSRSQVWREEKDKVDAIRREKVRKMIDYKGGRCQRCGYNKCIAALDFHHLDPSIKSFNFGSSMTRSMATLMQEADKCILLCSNCHRELHYNDAELARIKRTKDTRQQSMF